MENVNSSRKESKYLSCRWSNNSRCPNINVMNSSLTMKKEPGEAPKEFSREMLEQNEILCEKCDKYEKI